jgi:hypothetical protein
MRLPWLWPLIVNGLPAHPEFLVPAPLGLALLGDATPGASAS